MHTCAHFCYKNGALWDEDWCIVGFVQQALALYCLIWRTVLYRAIIYPENNMFHISSICMINALSCYIYLYIYIYMFFSSVLYIQQVFWGKKMIDSLNSTRNYQTEKTIVSGILFMCNVSWYFPAKTSKRRLPLLPNWLHGAKQSVHPKHRRISTVTWRGQDVETISALLACCMESS